MKDLKNCVEIRIILKIHVIICTLFITFLRVVLLKRPKKKEEERVVGGFDINKRKQLKLTKRKRETKVEEKFEVL